MVDGRWITIRRRHNLPHWEVEEGTYFVTFRLFDAALPRAKRMPIPQTPEARRCITLESHRRLDRLLDRTFGGATWLTTPSVAQLTLDALQFFHEDRYILHAGCVMPNHVHAVLRLAPGILLWKVMHSWKSYTSKEANKRLGRSGHFWQDEWWDSLAHDQHDLDKAIGYVEDNPSQAGLRDWPWVVVLNRDFRLNNL